MGKLDNILNSMGDNISESMGAGRKNAGPGDAGPKPPSTPPRMMGLTRTRNVAEIELGRIVRDPAQPREEFDHNGLERLAESLKSKGQLQPIRVRWDEGQGSYVILCGERRWRAAELAGLQTVTCVIHDGPLEDGELLALQLVENCLREDLKPIEQAQAFQKLMERNDWSARQLARELSLTQSFVARSLALLDLPESVQQMVDQGKLAPATACEISRVDNAEEQRQIAEQVVQQRLTRDQTAQTIKERKNGRARSQGPGRAPSTAGATKKLQYAVDGGTVTVSIDRPDANPAELLSQALEQARASESQARAS